MSNNYNLQKAKNKKTIYIFFVTFFFSMFIVGFIVKTLTPNVDVEIGDGVSGEQEADVDEENKGIDNRLKWIQFEDNMPGVSKRLGSTEQENTTSESETYQDDIAKLEERVRQAQTTIKTETTQESKSTPPVPKASDVAKQINAPSIPVRMSKVYIGYYTSIEQAITTQNKIMDAGLNINPFVKEVNGYYVVQAGSYSNKQKAQSIAGEISSLGFPAKVISE